MPTLKSPDGIGRNGKGRLGSVAKVSGRLADGFFASSGVLRIQDLQERFRRHLYGGSDELFREVTGFRFEVQWESSGSPPDVACLVGGGGCEGGVAVLDGFTAGRNGNGVLSVSGQHPPTNPVLACGRGGQDFSHPVEMNGLRLGVVVLQPLPLQGKARGRRALRDRGDAASDCALLQRATMLLRLVIHDAISATLAELRAEELVRARREIASDDRKSRRSRGKLQHVVIPPPRLAKGREQGSGIPAVVSLILDFVRACYPQPISLKDFARDHALNPSYLSTAFSSNVGVPFKKFLTEFRLEKARELLRDSTKNISDVATAVGYPDPNRFFVVFKAATGVSPLAFRKGKTSR